MGKLNRIQKISYKQKTYVAIINYPGWFSALQDDAIVMPLISSILIITKMRINDDEFSFELTFLYLFYVCWFSAYYMFVTPMENYYSKCVICSHQLRKYVKECINYTNYFKLCEFLKCPSRIHFMSKFDGV